MLKATSTVFATYAEPETLVFADDWQHLRILEVFIIQSTSSSELSILTQPKEVPLLTRHYWKNWFLYSSRFISASMLGEQRFNVSLKFCRRWNPSYWAKSNRVSIWINWFLRSCFFDFPRLVGYTSVSLYKLFLLLSECHHFSSASVSVRLSMHGRMRLLS